MLSKPRSIIIKFPLNGTFLYNKTSLEINVLNERNS